MRLSAENYIQTRLGNICMREQNYKKAFEWYTKTPNNSSSILNLSLLYLTGTGVDKDLDKAKTLFKILITKHRRTDLQNMYNNIGIIDYKYDYIKHSIYI